MARSSSGSWRGGAQPNIIDLDRYIRAGVRPSDDVSEADESDRLIVDAGGLSRELRRSSSDSSREHTARNQCKRYSHDSGLSDGSYAKRRHRTHRRRLASDVLMKRQQPLKEESSIREFKVVCQKALLEQQKQLARVTQLCEKLTERQATEVKCDRTMTKESSDSSELSSTSRSSGDERRKDHNRTQKCKTYKIIMSKLDELNRVFVQRGRSPPARPTLCPSVNLTDKVVATDVDRSDGFQKPQIMNQTILNGSGRRSPYGREHVVMRSTTQAYAVDIAPKEVSKFNGDSPNVLIESVVKSGQSSLGSGNSICDPRCGFDLNDPVHLYSQAKGLGMKYTHKLPGSGVRNENPADNLRSVSLCAVCRGYWKSLWNYFSTQLNDGPCKSF